MFSAPKAGPDRLLRLLTILAMVSVIGYFGARPAAEIISARVNRALPSLTLDGSNTWARLGRYGEQYVIPLTAGLYGLADEGSYFHAQTATPGTAYNLSGATQTTWVATTPTFYIKDNDTAGTGKRIYLDFVRVSVTAVGTGITRVEGAAIIDTNRTTSAGTALTAYNVNNDLATGTISTGIVGGAVTVAAAASPRYVCRFTLKTTAPVAGDTWLINFGAMDTATSTSNAANCGPSIIGGTHVAMVYLWFPGATATATGEVDAGWWER